jgi:hypothetical protein
MRQAGKIGKSLNAEITIEAGPSAFNFLDRYNSDRLSELFIVSGTGIIQVDRPVALSPDALDLTQLVPGSGAWITISPAASALPQCKRCWRHVPALETTSHGDEVCPRCAEALKI